MLVRLKNMLAKYLAGKLLFFLTLLGSICVHIGWEFNQRHWFGDFVLYTWAFIWLPIVIAYLAKITLQLNKKTSAFSIYFGMFFGGIINVLLSYFLENTETTNWIFLLYLFIILPSQLAAILIINFIQYLFTKTK